MSGKIAVGARRYIHVWCVFFVVAGAVCELYGVVRREASSAMKIRQNLHEVCLARSSDVGLHAG